MTTNATIHRTGPDHELIDVEEVKVADNNELVVDIKPGDTDEPLERSALPWLKDPNSRPSIWTIIKDMVGKDFSKMAVPVYFNDPTSLLQKCAQSMEYNYLLDLAAKE